MSFRRYVRITPYKYLPSPYSPRPFLSFFLSLFYFVVFLVVAHIWSPMSKYFPLIIWVSFSIVLSISFYLL